MRIGYLVNQYPKVSHSFIRREIAALEKRGFEIIRFSLREADGSLVDEYDHREHQKTYYVLNQAITKLLLDLLLVAISSPKRFLKALMMVCRLGRRADRPFPIHVIYLVEACHIARRIEKMGGIDHLHAHFGTNSAEVAMLVHILGGPTWSFTVHGPEEFDKPNFIGLPDKIKSSSFVIAISSFGRSQLYRWTDFSNWPKIKVVRCGVEPSYFHDFTKSQSLPNRFVCVGRLCEQKGQLILLEAAKRLISRGVHFELVLAGDGEMRAVLESVIEQEGLGGHVRVTGWISGSQVRAEILASRAFVLQSSLKVCR